MLATDTKLATSSSYIQSVFVFLNTKFLASTQHSSSSVNATNGHFVYLLNLNKLSNSPENTKEYINVVNVLCCNLFSLYSAIYFCDNKTVCYTSSLQNFILQDPEDQPIQTNIMGLFHIYKTSIYVLANFNLPANIGRYLYYRMSTSKSELCIQQ